MTATLAVLALAVVAALWLRGRRLRRRADALEWAENERWLAKLRRPLPPRGIHSPDSIRRWGGLYRISERDMGL